MALLFFAAEASALNVVTWSLTVTNPAATSNTAVIAGKTLTWTNQTTSTTVLTNSASVNGTMTNLFNQLGGSPIIGVSALMTDTNKLQLKGDGLAVSQTGNWCTLSASTNTGTNLFAYMIPAENLPNPFSKTNNASNMISSLKFSPLTSQVGTNWPGWTNVVTMGGGYYGGTQEIRAAKSFWDFQGTNRGTIWAGIMDGSRPTNQIGMNGTVHSLSNGLYKNPIIDGPTTTNLTNYGKAIRSPGTGCTGCDQFGTDAAATADDAFAVGPNAKATNLSAMAVGKNALAGGEDDMAVGPASRALGGSGTAVGVSATISNATGGLALGFAPLVTNNYSGAIGFNPRTTRDHQLVLMTSAESVTIPGMLEAGSATNNTWTGTNQLSGDLARPWYNLTTLGNSNNYAIPIWTNCYIRISGPTNTFLISGIAGGRNGREITLFNGSGYGMTLSQGTVDPTPANRITWNGSGDITFADGSLVDLKWIDADSKWHFNIPTAANTNIVTSGRSDTNLIVWPAATSGPALTVQGLASQAHPVFQVVSNATTNLTVHLNGTVTTTGLTNSGGANITGTLNAGGNVTFSNNLTVAGRLQGTNITLSASNTTSVPLSVTAASGAITNLAEFKDSSGYVVGGVASNGNLFASVSNSAVVYPATYRVFTMTGDLSVTNTQGVTNYWAPTGIGSLVLTQGFWARFNAVRVEQRGYVWTPVTPNPAIFMLSLTTASATNTLATNQYTLQGSLAAMPFEMDYLLTLRTNSATGYVYAQGKLQYVSGTDTTRTAPMRSTDLIMDTTAAATLSFSNTNGTSATGILIKELVVTAIP